MDERTDGRTEYSGSQLACENKRFIEPIWRSWGKCNQIGFNGTRTHPCSSTCLLMWSGWLKTGYCVVSALEALDKVSRALGDSNGNDDDGETVLIDFRTPPINKHFSAVRPRLIEKQMMKIESITLYYYSWYVRWLVVRSLCLNVCVFLIGWSEFRSPSQSISLRMEIQVFLLLLLYF